MAATGIELQSASPLSSSGSEQNIDLSDAQSVGKQASAQVDVSEPTPKDPSVLKEIPPKPDKEGTNDRMSDLPQNITQLTAPEEETSSPALHRSTSSSTRSVPRLNTRSGSIVGPLSWQQDTTGSPYTPTSHARKASYAPPPCAGSSSYSPSPDTKRLSLQISTPVTYNARRQQSSPFASSPLYSASSNSSSGQHIIDLSHPPGYAQDVRASFSDRLPHALSSRPHDTASTPFYTNDSSPFLANIYNNGISNPITPTRRGRGILDDDPSIYLGNKDEEGEDGEGWVEAAQRWARIAGKRLSQGEQRIWKMVEGLVGETDR